MNTTYPMLSEIEDDRPRGRTPSRRALLVGAGALGAGLAAGLQPASAAPLLRKGSRGAAVTSLQKKLTALKYWCGTADGSFGHLTQQAVYALQKAAGLAHDGVVGPKTYSALARKVQPVRKYKTGSVIEVDLKKQLMICTWQGKLSYILNTSTGSGKRYYSGGRWKTATTPKGSYKLFRLYSPGWQSGPLGSMYRPAYFYKGWAVHGSNSIPPYAASHGCCRISVSAMDRLWARGWIKKGFRVTVY